jgi:CubicO group peptidase (beta-lactamase class C family)
MPNTTSAPLDSARLDRAFDLVARQVSDGRASFASLAVARAEGLIRSAAFGRDGPLDAPPRTAIASITKPIVATAVMQLVEEGRLVLTEPVATYIQEFAPRPPEVSDGAGDSIAAWHVLTHTSGLADTPEEHFEAEPPTMADTLAWLCRSQLRFLPGTAYAYASDSFFVLAELIRRQSGLAHPTFLRQRIFEPLGMTATTFDPREPGPDPLPIEGSFLPADEGWPDALAWFSSWTAAGGGLWSTAEDVVRFGRCMLGDGKLDGRRILGPPFVRLMTRLHTADVPEHGTVRRPGYGLGWGLPGYGHGSPASSGSFGHTGATGSALVVDPDNDLVVVYLRNEWGASNQATDEAIQAVYGALQ